MTEAFDATETPVREELVTSQIGARLRIARRQRSMSLRSLAQALGVSPSLISQVETGKTQPSVSTLYAMVSYLGVSMDDLLGVTAGTALAPPGAEDPVATAPQAAGGVVQRAGEGPVLEMENGVRWERLATYPGGPIDPLLVSYEPGACSSVEGRMMRHAGVEHAYLVEGELTLQLDFDTYVLRAGDSLTFDSVRPHMYTNKSDQVARGVWYVVGRRQHHGSMPAADDAGMPRADQLSSAVDVLQVMDDLHG